MLPPKTYSLRTSTMTRIAVRNVSVRRVSTRHWYGKSAGAHVACARASTIMPSSPSLHRDSMWSRRSRGECGVEVDVEPPVQRELFPGHADHTNMMVPFQMDFAEVVLVQEVIADDEPLVVVGQRNHVRTGVDAEIDDAGLNRVLRIGDIEHADLTRLEGCEDQPVAGSWHREQLRHPAANGNLYVRHDVLAVEDDLRGSVRGVDEVDEAVEHAGGERAALRILRDQLDVHG